MRYADKVLKSKALSSGEILHPRHHPYHLGGAKIGVEAKLGKRVDLVRKRRDLSEQFLRRIEKTIHYV
jgi:hypothetical protein